MDRQRQIGAIYEAFRAVRRLPADSLCLEWINAILQAGGQAAMTGDERRLVEAHIRCTWDAWPGVGAAVAVKPDPSEWPGWLEGVEGKSETVSDLGGRKAGTSTAGPAGVVAGLFD